MSEDSTPLYKALLGDKHQAYYLAYFHRADTRGYAPLSWHWPALFFGFFWFLYRRQFRWALIFMAVSLCLTAIASTLAAQGFRSLAIPAYYTAMIGFQLVYVPLRANAIYYQWAVNEISGVRAAFPGQPKQQLEYLQTRGGVLKHLPAIVFGILAVMAMVSAPLDQVAQ